MAKINIKIEGIPYQVEAGLTIMEAAKACGYEIPSLCTFNHGECNVGSCRVCLVEATGARGLVASCVYPVAEGMEIRIGSPAATEARRRSVELLLSNHNKNCQQCDKNGNCELLHVATLTGARVSAPDLRAGAALVIAGLAAEGITIVDDIRYIQRGYECFDEKLRGLGAEIRQVDSVREAQKYAWRVS